MIDRIDSEILRSLQKNARLSNKELASGIGLAPSSTLERVRRLFEDGTLRGAHAEVDPEALGIGLQALIAVRLARHSRSEVKAFQEQTLERPEVVRVYHLAGATDFLVHVAVRDPEHLREVVLDAFTARAEVAHVETSLIFDHHRANALPDYTREAGDA